MSSANTFLKRFLTAILAAVRECAEAQRRMDTLRLAPDRHMVAPDAAPDTYAEFLLRTSGTLHHEPPARARLRPARR
jgi:hypothetical protein